MKRTPRLRPLLDHQRPALEYTCATPHPALWMQMRLGKTAVCVRAVESYGDRPRAIVIAPNSALGDWERELAREGVTPKDVVRLSGPRSKRLYALVKSNARWFLLNKEGWQVVPEVAGAARCEDCNGRGYSIIVNDEKVLCTACLGRGYIDGGAPTPGWNAVVLDESTFVKNPRARVTKFMLSHFRDVPHRWSMTGLPNPEGPLDVWCQLAWLDPRGRALGCKSYWEFRARYFTESCDGYGFEPRKGTMELINRLVAARAFVMTRKDAGVEFVRARQRREVEMPARLHKSYRAAEQDYVLELDGREVKRTMYATPRWHWMRQMCGGFVDGELVWDGKIKELLGLLRGELAGEQVVVWFAYNQELHAVSVALTQAGIPCNSIWGDVPVRAREERLDSWRHGDTQVLLAQMAALDRGVDLSAADTAVYYSTHASGEMRQQSEDRIAHPSKHAPLLIVDLVVPRTVDEDVVETLGVKKWQSDAALRRAVALRMRRRQK